MTAALYSSAAGVKCWDPARLPVRRPFPSSSQQPYTITRSCHWWESAPLWLPLVNPGWWSQVLISYAWGRVSRAGGSHGSGSRPSSRSGDDETSFGAGDHGGAPRRAGGPGFPRLRVPSWPPRGFLVPQVHGGGTAARSPRQVPTAALGAGSLTVAGLATRRLRPGEGAHSTPRKPHPTPGLHLVWVLRAPVLRISGLVGEGKVQVGDLTHYLGSKRHLSPT